MGGPSPESRKFVCAARRGSRRRRHRGRQYRDLRRCDHHSVWKAATIVEKHILLFPGHCCQRRILFALDSCISLALEIKWSDDAGVRHVIIHDLIACQGLLKTVKINSGAKHEAKFLISRFQDYFKRLLSSWAGVTRNKARAIEVKVYPAGYKEGKAVSIRVG
jgi:hypothetical protein